MTPQAKETNEICGRLADKAEARCKAKEAAIFADDSSADDRHKLIVAANREWSSAMDSISVIRYNLGLAEATYSEEGRLRAIVEAEKLEREIAL